MVDGHFLSFVPMIGIANDFVINRHLKELGGMLSINANILAPEFCAPDSKAFVLEPLKRYVF